MELSDKAVREITRRIMLARMRLLVNNGFYGLLLMHTKFSLSMAYDTAWTDGKERIWFNPEFVAEITDKELEYVLLHELLHMVLKHPLRRGNMDHETFNWAADIIVNSTIYLSCEKDESAISVKWNGGVQPHLAPDGKEGAEYTVEELFRMLYAYRKKQEGDEDDKQYVLGGSGWDSHVFEEFSDREIEEIEYTWAGYVKQACEAISIRDATKQRGLLPAFAERILSSLKKPQTDWRQLLTEFVQEEVNDYSFTPPDRRMEESPFFLPDFNERDMRPGKILFAVDCSGSMSDEEIATCYSEIKGAIEQFDGKLEGWIGFFDAAFTKPVPFETVEDLVAIKPIGGGGTSFEVVFAYLATLEEDEYPTSIVILTDGYAPFPKESMALGIPVLWIINNDQVQVPWGKVARIQ